MEFGLRGKHFSRAQHFWKTVQTTFQTLRLQNTWNDKIGRKMSVTVRQWRRFKVQEGRTWCLFTTRCHSSLTVRATKTNRLPARTTTAMKSQRSRQWLCSESIPRRKKHILSEKSIDGLAKSTRRIDQQVTCTCMCCAGRGTDGSVRTSFLTLRVT